MDLQVKSLVALGIAALVLIGCSKPEGPFRKAFMSEETCAAPHDLGPANRETFAPDHHRCPLQKHLLPGAGDARAAREELARAVAQAQAEAAATGEPVRIVSVKTALPDENWPALAPRLKGKLHLIVGAEDTFHLEEAVVLLCDFLKTKGEKRACEIVPGRDHTDLYRSHHTYPEGLSIRIDNEMRFRPGSTASTVTVTRWLTLTISAGFRTNLSASWLICTSPS